MTAKGNTMNTATLTAEQQQEVARLLQGFDTITPAHEEMAIRLVMQTAAEIESDSKTEIVERRKKCPQGHSRVHSFYLECDEDGNYSRNDRGDIFANATCDECEETFYDFIRLTSKEKKGA
jgi:hypothetical protein